MTSDQHGTGSTDDRPDLARFLTWLKGQWPLLRAAWIPVSVLLIITILFTHRISERHYKGRIDAIGQELSLYKSRLDTTLSDANEAIEEMKLLGVALSTPIVSEMASPKLSFPSGSDRTLEDSVNEVNEIADTLGKIGVDEATIDFVRQPWDDMIETHLIRKAFLSVKEANENRGSDLFESQHVYRWNRDRLESFVGSNGLRVPDAYHEALEHLDRYMKTRKYSGEW